MPDQPSIELRRAMYFALESGDVRLEVDGRGRFCFARTTRSDEPAFESFYIPVKHIDDAIAMLQRAKEELAKDA